MKRLAYVNEYPNGKLSQEEVDKLTETRNSIKKITKKKKNSTVEKKKNVTAKKKVTTKKTKKIKKHKQNVHNEYSLEQLKLILKKMPVSERKKFIKKVLGPGQNNSTDIFSKGRVVSGGGYGLGRNRKH